MFALVESGSITKMLNGNKGIQIGDLKYPRAIYTLWTEQREMPSVSILLNMMTVIKKMRNGISIQINLMHLVVVKSQQHMVLQLLRHTLTLYTHKKTKITV